MVTPLGMQSANGTPSEALSFERIYQEWFGPVSRWALALGARRSDHEDLVQDVFTVAYRRLHLFDGHNIAGWLYLITRRKARDYRQLAWVRHLFTSETSPPLHSAPHTGTGPLELLETKRKAEVLQRRLAKLPSAQRAVFTLFELEGLSGHEIAQQQQAPLATVWVRLFTARRKLKRHPRAPDNRSAQKRRKNATH
jgi:RNA polymerase sigma-70 factor (ECF subfamily)